MKRPHPGGQSNNNKLRKIRNARSRNNRDERVNELLKICLQKVCELQADLQRNEVEENDPEAAGYAACAMETLRFLAAEGLPSDHPIVKTLTERILRERD